jgi:hypothetical protein
LKEEQIRRFRQEICKIGWALSLGDEELPLAKVTAQIPLRRVDSDRDRVDHSSMELLLRPSLKLPLFLQASIR